MKKIYALSLVTMLDPFWYDSVGGCSASWQKIKFFNCPVDGCSAKLIVPPLFGDDFSGGCSASGQKINV